MSPSDYPQGAGGILVVTGPAGAGKSVTADLIAASIPHKTSRLSTDDIRDFVRSGYADPSEGWTADVIEQVQLARSIARDAATRYAELGYLAVVDDIVSPSEPHLGPDHWIVAGVRTQFLVLFPSWEQVVERNRARMGFRLLAKPHLRAVYDMMRSWQLHDHGQTLIDNSAMGIEETARAAVDRLGLVG